MPPFPTAAVPVAPSQKKPDRPWSAAPPDVGGCPPGPPMGMWVGVRVGIGGG